MKEYNVIKRVRKIFEQLEFYIPRISKNEDIFSISGNTSEIVWIDLIAKKKLNTKREYTILIEITGGGELKDAVDYGTTALERIQKANQTDKEYHFDKLLLVLSNDDESDEAQILELINQQKHNPTEIEIIKLAELERWGEYLNQEFRNDELNEVQILIRRLSQKLIAIIANNPNLLMGLEWRDLERTVSELFTELGFDTTLTPGSKDGGKDIILNCKINNETKSFIVEIKHWRSGHKVGKKAVKEFTQVVINENRDKGLFISTYGFTQNYLENLTQVERKKVRFGQKEKIIELCTTYEKIKNGIWLPTNSIDNLLFKNTN